MADQIFSEIFDDSNALEALDKIEKKLQSIEQAAKSSGGAINEAYGEAEKAVNDLNTTLDDSAKTTAEQAKAVGQAEANTSRWKKALDGTLGSLQVFGKTLSEWKGKLVSAKNSVLELKAATEGLAIANKGISGAFQVAATAARGLGLALKAIGLGLIIAMVSSVAAYLNRFQSGMDKVAQVTSAVSAVTDVLIKRFLLMAQATFSVSKGLFSIITLDFSGAINNFSNAADNAIASVSGLGAELVNTAKDALALEQQFQALRDAAIRASVITARQEVELAKLKNAMDDGTAAIGSRIDATAKAGALEVEIAQRNLELAKEDLRLKQLKLDMQENSGANIEAEAEAQKKFSEAEIALNDAKFNKESKLRELRKQAADERHKQAEQDQKDFEKIRKDLEKLRLEGMADGMDKDLAAVNQRFDGLIKTAQDGISKLNEIEKRRGLTPDEIKAKQNLADVQVTIEIQRLVALNEILEKYNEQDTKLREDQLRRQKELTEKERKQAEEEITAQSELRKTQLKQGEEAVEAYLLRLQQQGAKESEIREARAEFDLEIQKARIQAEIETQQQLLAVADQNDKSRVDQLKANIGLLTAELENVIFKIENKPKKPFSLLSLLGIDPEKDKEALEAAKEVFGQALDSFKELNQAQIAEQEAIVSALDERIRKQEEVIAKEAQLQEDGKANNLKSEKDRLAKLKAERDKALAEEAKAKRAAILLDSVQQVSNLITASTKIFNSLAGLGPFGVPLAIGLIAAMFGAFVAAKAKALKAVEAPKFRKGGKLVGPLHEQGGVAISDYGGNVYGEAEGGEYIIPREATAEHEQHLDRVRKGEFRGIDLSRLEPEKMRYRGHIHAAADSIRETELRRAEVGEAQHFRAIQSAYEKSTDRIVRAIESKPDVYPWKGGYIERRKKGNVTTRETVLPKE